MESAVKAMTGTCHRLNFYIVGEILRNRDCKLIFELSKIGPHSVARDKNWCLKLNGGSSLGKFIGIGNNLLGISPVAIKYQKTGSYHSDDNTQEKK